MGTRRGDRVHGARLLHRKCDYYARLQAHGLTMPDTPRDLRPMSDFNPSEPAILHDRVSGVIETWTGEYEAEYRKKATELPDGAVAWRGFVFDGWGNVLGG
jgi:hypothetical protein